MRSAQPTALDWNLSGTSPQLTALHEHQRTIFAGFASHLTDSVTRDRTLGVTTIELDGDRLYAASTTGRSKLCTFNDWYGSDDPQCTNTLHTFLAFLNNLINRSQVFLDSNPSQTQKITAYRLLHSLQRSSSNFARRVAAQVTGNRGQAFQTTTWALPEAPYNLLGHTSLPPFLLTALVPVPPDASNPATLARTNRQLLSSITIKAPPGVDPTAWQRHCAYALSQALADHYDRAVTEIGRRLFAGRLPPTAQQPLPTMDWSTSGEEPRPQQLVPPPSPFRSAWTQRVASFEPYGRDRFYWSQLFNLHALYEVGVILWALLLPFYHLVRGLVGLVWGGASALWAWTLGQPTQAHRDRCKRSARLIGFVPLLMASAVVVLVSGLVGILHAVLIHTKHLLHHTDRWLDRHQLWPLPVGFLVLSSTAVITLVLLNAYHHNSLLLAFHHAHLPYLPPYGITQQTLLFLASTTLFTCLNQLYKLAAHRLFGVAAHPNLVNQQASTHVMTEVFSWTAVLTCTIALFQGPLRALSSTTQDVLSITLLMMLFFMVHLGAHWMAKLDRTPVVLGNWPNPLDSTTMNALPTTSYAHTAKAHLSDAFVEDAGANRSLLP